VISTGLPITSPATPHLTKSAPGTPSSSSVTVNSSSVSSSSSAAPLPAVKDSIPGLLVNDEIIELVHHLSLNGYCILYISHHSSSSSSSSSASSTAYRLLQQSSREFLSRIHTIKRKQRNPLTREEETISLPFGPIFRSPESLVQTFGPLRTELFKAAALRGVRGLFPSSYHVFHSGFISRRNDIIALERNHFPIGRIFIIKERNDEDKVEFHQIHRSNLIRSSQEMIELVNEMFPLVDLSHISPTVGTIKTETEKDGIFLFCWCFFVVSSFCF
jgi:hypothetical protein